MIDTIQTRIFIIQQQIKTTRNKKGRSYVKLKTGYRQKEFAIARTKKKKVLPVPVNKVFPRMKLMILKLRTLMIVIIIMKKNWNILEKLTTKII